MLRRWTWVVVAIACGCGGDDEGVRRNPWDAEMFARLTAQSWIACSGQDEWSSCEVLELHADGTHDWSISSDVPELEDHGAWTFESFASDRGILRFEQGSVVDFVLDDAAIELRGHALAPSASLPTAGELEDLPDLGLDARYEQLLGTEWVKANAFDRGAVPDRLTFDREGMTAGFRAGECELDLRWSFVAVDDAPTLAAVVPANDCIVLPDFGGAATWSSGEIVQDGDRLQLSYHSYVRADAAGDEQWIEIGERQDVGLEISGRFVGELALDRDTAIDFTITRTDPESVRLQALRAWLTWGDDATEVDAMTLDLGDRTIATGEHVTATGTLRLQRPDGVAPGSEATLFFELATDAELGPREWFAIELPE